MAKRDKHGRMMMTVSRNTADIIEGLADLSSWDDEELLRGARRSKNGNFVGKPPNVVPAAIHQERTRRVMSKAYDLLRESTIDAVELLRSVINDDDAPLPERLKAAELVMARTLPKNENVNVTVAPTPAFLDAIEAATIITTDTGPDDDVIDAEVVDDDELLFE